MGVTLCILGSGSSGNCTYLAGGGTGILIDAGLSLRETEKRLQEAVGADLSSVSAVCLTHEHSDHTAGLVALHRRHGVPVYANSGTCRAMEETGGGEVAWNVFQTGFPFRIGGLQVEPFSVSHDAVDPVGYVVSDGDVRIGVVTDMGVGTGLVQMRLQPCDVVVIESNHDVALLRGSSRPWTLKQRIMGRQGHLSNADAAKLLARLAGSRLRRVYLAHLSVDCNRPHLAVQEAERSLRSCGAPHVEVRLTYPDRASEAWTWG